MCAVGGHRQLLPLVFLVDASQGLLPSWSSGGDGSFQGSWAPLVWSRCPLLEARELLVPQLLSEGLLLIEL